MASATDVDVSIRRATADDYDAVVDLTADVWTDRGGDYLQYVYEDWIAGDAETKHTFVAEVDGELAGLLQCVLLSDHEAWMQGMRVDSAYRGHGLSVRLSDAAFRWARERGATVARNMVYSWNVAGLGGSRAAGFDPCTEFRWAHPEPDADADAVEIDADGALTVTDEADAAWSFWTSSDARDALRGLVLDDEESWAVSELTRERLRTAAAEDRLFVAQGDGTRGFTYRNRIYDMPDENGDAKTWAEYAVGAWTDREACETLLAAVARDAAAVDADRTRVLIPESVRWVSDVAAARVDVADEPDFVMAADLTRVGADER